MSLGEMNSNSGANPSITESALVRKLLWDCFPGQRERILSLEEDERDYVTPDNPSPEVGAYTLTSDVFVAGVLTPFLQSPPPRDRDVGERCSRFIELLLASERPFIREMVSIRITDHILGYPGNWEKFKTYAGELLLREVGERRIYYRDIR